MTLNESRQQDVSTLGHTPAAAAGDLGQQAVDV